MNYTLNYENLNEEKRQIPSWDEIARENQKIPIGDWDVWLIMAGRGFGKTRTGAESVLKLIESGRYKNIAIIGRNINETRHVMVEGSSGILQSRPFDKTTRYYSSRRQIIWENGAKATLIGGDNYESLRGYQFDLIWIDEFAKFSKPTELWEQILFTLRIGADPKCIVTTTPRPLSILEELMKAKGTYLTNGSTYENCDNLSAKFLETMKVRYENTRTGDQEIHGKLLMEKENALWKERSITYKDISIEDINKITIGVDPAVTGKESSDETGIVVAGKGKDGKLYILDDLSGKYQSCEWAKKVVEAYKKYSADCVVAEVNNGGDLVEAMLRGIDRYIPYKSVRAIRGKVSRAEPVALLYESSLVHHKRRFKELETQMTNISRDDEKITPSPDRLDAMVWAINDLTSETFNEPHCMLI